MATVSINREVYEEAKAYAKVHNIPLSKWVESLVRALLGRGPSARKASRRSVARGR